MAIPDSTWRPHPFKIGQTYIAAKSFTGLPSFEFVKGASYTLHHIAYSHYDSATVFTFKELGGNDSSNWWWFDEEPDSLCSERFQVGA